MKESKEEQALFDLDTELAKDLQLIGRVPKWPVSVGFLVIGVIYFFLPTELRVGPSWVLLIIEIVLIIPLWIFWATGHTLSYPTTRCTGLLLLGIVTLVLAISVIFLVTDLSAFTSGFKLLRTAGLLWLLNILVFALWYWDTDGGGPRKRHEADHKAADFLFPQQANGASWAPDFFDYLFVSFTSATAFSPTDTAPLTHQAKLMMMVEGSISLIIVAILVSRVANIF
jgi:hypothetical protein